MTVRTKLIAILCLVGLTGALLSLFIFYRSIDGMEAQFNENFQDDARLLIERIDANMFERFKDIQVFAENFATVYKRVSDNNDVPATFTEVSNRYTLHYKTYRRMLLFDMQGQLVSQNTLNENGHAIPALYTEPDYVTAQNWFQETINDRALNRASTSSATVFGPDNFFPDSESQNQSGEPIFDMLYAVKLKDSDGKPIGLWVNLADFKIIESVVIDAYLLLAAGGFPKTELTLLDSLGRIIVDYDPYLSGRLAYQRDLTVLNELNLSTTGVEAARLAVLGQTGAIRSLHYRKQIFQLSGFAHSSGYLDYPGLGWSSLIRLDEADLNKALTSDLINAIIVSILILFGITILAIRIGSNFGSDLQGLTSKIRELADGKIPESAPNIRSHKELIDLSTSIHNLKQHLQEKRAFEFENKHQKERLLFLNRAIEYMSNAVKVIEKTNHSYPIVYANQASEKSSGYSPDYFIDKDYFDFIDPQTDQQQINLLKEALRDGRSAQITLSHKKWNNKPYISSVNLDPVFDESGVLCYFIAVETDLTTLWKEEEMNREQLKQIVTHKTQQAKDNIAQLRAILNSTVDGILVYDADGIILEANTFIAELLGCGRSRLIGNRIDSLIPAVKSDNSLISQWFPNPREYRKSNSFQHVFKRTDGTPTFCSVSIGSNNSTDKSFYVAVIRDETEVAELSSSRERLLNQLGESQLIFQSIFQKSAVGMIRLSVDEVILDVNDALCHIFKINTEQIHGRTLQDLIEDDKTLESIHHSFNLLMSAPSDSSSITKEYSLLDSLGENLWLMITVSTIKNEQGALLYFVFAIQNVTDRKNAELELKESKKRQEELLLGQQLASEAAGIFSWSWNFADEKMMWDQAMQAFYTRESNGEEPTFRDWLAFVHPDDQNDFMTTAYEAIETLMPWVIECRIIHPGDEQLRWVQIAGAVLLDSSGIPTQMHGIHTDVTDERLVQFALERESQAALEAAEAKSRFLAAMSHEIRTPMNGVIGLVELLKDSNLDNNQSQMVVSIQESAFALLTIINDILDFSKIESGELTVEGIPVNVNSILENSFDAVTIMASQGNVSLQIYIDIDIPTNLMSDPIRLRQVILNLLSNAVKFSANQERKGRVIAKSQYRGQSWVLSIEDNGIGMTEDQIAKLFLPFSQADSSTTRKFGGTGLGLSITKSLLDIMKGTIDVDSKVGIGSTFTLTLPLSVEDKPVFDFPERLEDASVWIDINEPELNKMVHYTLAQTEITILDRQSDSKFANFCIVSEENRQYYDDKKQLLLSSNPSKKQQLVNNRQYLLSSILLKPSELIEGCAILLGRSSPKIRAKMIEAIDKPIDRDQAVSLKQSILVVEDQALNRDVIKRQLTRLGYHCDLAEDGLLGLKAFESNDYDLILSDCHMPNMDGYEMAEKIRAWERSHNKSKSVPIVAVTANAIVGEDHRCFESGMDDYLTKPVELSELSKILEKWIGRSSLRSTSDSTDDAEDGETTASLDRPVNLDALIEILGDDDPELIQSILSSGFESLQSGLEGLDKAIEQMDVKNIGDLAHGLKGVASYSSAEDLTAIFLALELAGKTNQVEVIQKEWPRVESEMSRLKAYLESVGIVAS